MVFSVSFWLLCAFELLGCRMLFLFTEQSLSFVILIIHSLLRMAQMQFLAHRCTPDVSLAFSIEQLEGGGGGSH